MIRRLLLLLMGSLAFWVLVALPARALSDDPETAERAIVYSGTAVLLCLVPTALTLIWSSRALRQDPHTQLTAVMGGTAFRLFGTLLAGFAISSTFAYYRESSFWNWLLAAYLFTLGLEMTLLLAGKPAAAPKP